MVSRYVDDFGPFGEITWLNSAHQGPLPRVAVREAEEAIAWKRIPSELTTDRFREVPDRLRRLLGRLVGVPAEDIILANSASYGLHLLANGVPWREGDEVVVARNDFPSDILPWLGLGERGVRVRRLRPRNHVLQPDELAEGLGPHTRLVCLSWVHSFSGHTIDLEAMGEICRTRGVIFVLNASQALGARSLDLSVIPVHAVTCVGFKWLCGPYGTGFAWVRPDLREELRYNQAYWLAMQTTDELGGTQGEPELREGLGARKYDLFGTANFFNFKPWAAAIEYLLSRGMEAVRAHDQTLVERLVAGLDPGRFELISPREAPTRSTLVIVSHRDRRRNRAVHEALTEENVHTALRRGNIRISPHLHNTPEDIDRALAVLDRE